MTASRRYCQRSAASRRSAAPSTWTSSSATLLGDAQLIPTREALSDHDARQRLPSRARARAAPPRRARSPSTSACAWASAADDARLARRHRSLLPRHRRREHDLPWQTCVSSLVWFIGTEQRGAMRNSAFLEFLGTEAKHLEQAGLLRHEPLVSSPPGPTITRRRSRAHQLRVERLPRPVASSRGQEGGHRRRRDSGASDWRRRAWRPARCRCTPSSSARWRNSSAPATRSSIRAAITPTPGLFESLLSDRDYLFCDELIRPSLADGIAPVPRARLLVSQPGHGAPRGSPAALALGALPRHRHRRRLPAIGAGRPTCATSTGWPPSTTRSSSSTTARASASSASTAAARTTQLGLADRIDLVTGTFGAALGGGAGGFVAGRKEMVGLAAAEVARVSVVDGAAAGVGGGGGEVARAVAHRAAAARDSST